MLNTTYPKRLRRCLSSLCAVATLMLSPVALAQSEYYFIPWVTLEGVYDDNVFFDSDGEISDTITRLSPQLEVGLDSETLRWFFRFRNDSEWYQDLTDLDDSTARQFGIASIEYTPNRRWSFDGNAEYTQTNSAQDLSLTPGGGIPGLVGRVEAERRLLGGGADYRFSQQWTGGVDLTWVSDEVEDATKTDTLSAAALFEQTLTPTRSLLYSYDYRDYEFEQVSGTEPSFIITDSDDSHTVWVGWKEALSETSDLELRAGPRFGDGDVDPYLLARWVRTYDRGNTSIDVSWDESTLLGEIGRLETKSIYASWNHEFSEDVEARASAGYADVSGDGYQADIASAELAGVYNFNRYVYVTARYSFNVQDIETTGVPASEVTHNVFSLSITLTRPRRDSEGGTI